MIHYLALTKNHNPVKSKLFPQSLIPYIEILDKIQNYIHYLYILKFICLFRKNLLKCYLIKIKI